MDRDIPASYIVMTAAQASAVRYFDNACGAGLEPVKLADGVTYVLPLRVMDDPAHAAKRDMLMALPKRVIADEEWPVKPAAD